MHNPSAFWIVLLALALTGCGREVRGPEPPPPGTVELKAEMPLNAQWYAPSLVPNDRFQRWPLGAPAPDGYDAPDIRFSRVANVGGAARQTWEQSDGGLPLRSFRSRLALRAGISYRLIVLAETNGDGLVTMDLLHAPVGQAAEMVLPTLLTLQPGDGILKQYACDFTVPESGGYLLIAQAVLAPGGSMTATWHRWHIVEMAEGEM